MSVRFPNGKEKESEGVSLQGLWKFGQLLVYAFKGDRILLRI